jgi:hypothetical protein
MQSTFSLPASWDDPNPVPFAHYLDPHTLVVRDDLLPGGTKTRALDYLIGHDPDFAMIQEWVYGEAPAHGYAQIALPIVCGRYGKRAVLFMADRRQETWHHCQKRGMEEGGIYHWVPNGMLSVTRKRARDYVNESPLTRKQVPMGGDVPSAVACLVRAMRQMYVPFAPTDVWSVISSGTLSRALQEAFPNATVHGVVVGHHPTLEQSGRAVLYQSSYKFAQPIKAQDAPPYPSVAEYDAKLWPIYQSWRTTHPDANVLIWNVGA